MSRKDRNTVKRPLSLRVLAVVLAMTLLFTSSGFQIVAEESQATESQPSSEEAQAELARQESEAESERVRKESEAQSEAARLQAESEAQSEAARLQAESEAESERARKESEKQSEADAEAKKKAEEAKEAKEITYKVTFEKHAADHGVICVEQLPVTVSSYYKEVKENDKFVFVVKAAEGYEIDRVTADNVDVPKTVNADEYQIEMVQKDIEIVITYKVLPQETATDVEADAAEENAESETEVTAEFETEVETEVTTEVETEVETEVTTEVESELTTETELMTELESELETEVESETELESESETEVAELTASVQQNVVQITGTDSKTAVYVKTDITVSNISETAEATNVSVQALLSDNMTREAKNDDTAAIETYASAAELPAAEDAEAVSYGGYADAEAVAWSAQTLAAGETKTYRFTAKVAEGITDTAELQNAWYVNGKAIDAASWSGTDNLVIEEKPKTSFTYEDSRVRITALATASANLPQNAELKADYMPEGSAAYNAAVGAVEAQMGSDDTEFLAFVCYDVYFEADGEKIEPEAGTVRVSMRYKQPEFAEVADQVDEYLTYHINEQTNVVEDVTGSVSTNSEGEVTSVGFSTTSFSPIVTAARLDESITITYSDYGVGDGTWSTNKFYISTWDDDGDGVLEDGEKVNDNQIAYCIQAFFGSPGDSDYGSSGSNPGQFEDNLATIKGSDKLQKVMYYGYGGAGNSMSYDTENRMAAFDTFISSVSTSSEFTAKYAQMTNAEKEDLCLILTHVAASYAYFQDNGTSFAEYVKIQMDYQDKTEEEHQEFIDELYKLLSDAGIDTTDAHYNLNLSGSVWGMNSDGVKLAVAWYDEIMRKDDPELRLVAGEEELKSEGNASQVTTKTDDTVYTFDANTINPELKLQFTVPEGWKCTVVNGDAYEENELVTVNPSQDFYFSSVRTAFSTVPGSISVNTRFITGTLDGTEKEAWKIVLLHTSKTLGTTAGRDQDIAGISLTDAGRKVMNLQVQERKASVTLKKVNTENQPLANAKFEVYYDAAYTDPVMVNGTELTLTTGSDGTAYLEYIITEKIISNGNCLYVKEVEAPHGYEIQGDGKFSILTTETAKTVTNDHELTSISGSKVWNDAENQDGKRPSSITVNLHQNGKRIDSRTVTASDNWSWTFSNLRKYDDQGKLYTYTFSEEAVAEYTTSYSSDTTIIYNGHETAKVDKNGSKTWNDQENKYGTRSESIIIKLYGSYTTGDGRTKWLDYSSQGVETETYYRVDIGVDADTNWSWNFANLPKYWEGCEINWYVKEVDVPGYVVTEDGMNLTNTLITVDIEVTKTWSVPEGKAVPDVTVVLKRNGEVYESQVLKADNNWNYTWNDMPKYYVSGDTVHAYTYDIEEVAIDGCTITKETATDSDGNYSINLTNHYEASGSTAFEIEKVLTGNRAEAIKAGEFTFQADLVSVLAAGSHVQNSYSGSVNAAAGDASRASITFETITFDEYDAGFTYVFRLTEDKDEDATIDYSEQEIYAAVTVTDSGEIDPDTHEGILTAEIKYYEDPECLYELTEAAFVNHYNAQGSASLTAGKLLTGNRDEAIEADEFTFRAELASVPADGSSVKSVYTGVVGAGKDDARAEADVTFETIEFDEYDIGATYVFRLTEDKGTDTTIEYSEKEIYAAITVTDAGEGKLSASVEYYDDVECLYPLTEVVFTNNYDAAGEAAFTAAKFLTGNRAKAIAAGEFTFQADLVSIPADGSSIKESYTGSVNAADTATGAEAAVSFETMLFDENDIGATYTFRLTEVAGTDPAMEYAAAEVYATVTVTDSGRVNGETGKGILDTVVNYYEDPECLVPLAAAEYANAYHASGELIIDNVMKVLENSPLAEGQFTFELKDAEGNVLQTKTNGADGRVVFDAIPYTEEDISKEFVYTVSEVNNNVSGVTYDETVYTVTVKVEDSEAGDGTLKITTEVQNGSDPVDEMLYTNTFAGFVKLNKTGQDGQVLPGAKFQLYAKNASGEWAVYTGTYEDGIYTTDINGVITVETLPANDYCFVETEAPKGYVIATEADGSSRKYPFTIGVVDGDAGVVENVVVNAELFVDNRADAEDTTIVVTKLITFYGTEIHAVDETFYVALFEDEACTKRVSEVRPIVFKDESASSVSFTDLKFGKGYYVAETDQEGNVITSGTIAGDGMFTVNFAQGNYAEITEGDGTKTIIFENQLLNIPAGYYKEGVLTITKKLVGADGHEKASEGVFYAGIFADKEFTQLADQVSENIVKLDLNGSSEVSRTVKVAIDPTKAVTLYVTEVDVDGNPVADADNFHYTVAISDSEVTLDETNATASVVITNCEEETEETEVETEAETEEEAEEETEEEAVKTGDETPVAPFAGLMFASAFVLLALAEMRRRRNRA